MSRLQSIRYTQGSKAILGILDRSSKLNQPGAVTHPCKDVDWLSNNQVKGFQKFCDYPSRIGSNFPINIGISRIRNGRVNCLPADAILGNNSRNGSGIRFRSLGHFLGPGRTSIPLVNFNATSLPSSAPMVANTPCFSDGFH